jgi:lysophospholipase L1-like esterase
VGRAVTPTRIAAGALAGLLGVSAPAGSSEPVSVTGSTVPPPAAVAGAPRTIRYVALGDSYTAAPVAPSPATDEPCYHSETNYPRVLTRALGRTRLVDVSCSGASTRALSQAQREDVPPQFDALTAGTDLVTLGVGGNDERLFMSWYLQCTRVAASDPTGNPCERASQSEDGDVMLAKVPQIRRNLVAAIRGIRARAPHAVVVVVTYPRILPRSGTCPDRVTFAAGDYGYINRIVSALDDAVVAAATRTGVRWVDVERASRGHDICSSTPWVNGTTGDQSRATWLHPFPEEQAAVARLVEQAL